MRKGKAAQILQVCWEVDGGNEEREVAGLLAALDFFKCETGVIITRNQRDTILQGRRTMFFRRLRASRFTGGYSH